MQLPTSTKATEAPQAAAGALKEKLAAPLPLLAISARSVGPERGTVNPAQAPLGLVKDPAPPESTATPPLGVPLLLLSVTNPGQVPVLVSVKLGGPPPVNSIPRRSEYPPLPIKVETPVLVLIE